MHDCFLLFHEINEEPRNMHQSMTDRQVSGQPSQSTSLEEINLGGVSMGKINLAKKYLQIV